MRINNSPPHLFAGIDNLSLDKRNFNPSRDDIEHICRFFSIGKLKHHEKEKGIAVSHSNFFIFVTTSRGQYALKFYPADAAKTVTAEYAINHFLISCHFPTPVMYTGDGGRPFLTSHHGRLATCFSYINGKQSWQCIKQHNTIRQINAALLSLKNTLSMAKGRIPFTQQENFTATVRSLARTSHVMAPYDPKKMIDASLRNACRSYQQHQPLFTRRRVHNNAGLTNFIVAKRTVYTLDLSHIREDYALSDLASLTISCLFLKIPLTTIKTIIKDYFTQHQLDAEYAPVLHTLVQVGLIKEYLKNVRREKSAGLSNCPTDLARTYKFHLSARKKSIAATLRKMHDTLRFII